MAKGNPNPVIGRLSRNRKEQGSIEEARGVMWGAIKNLEGHLHRVSGEEEPSTAEVCKLSHALSQSMAVFTKLLEVGELESRLQALEQERAA